VTIPEIAASPATWAIYILVIVAFMLLSLWKTHFTRDTWTNFFQFMFGLGAFLAGLGFGFHAIGHGLGTGINLEYTVESIISLIFIIAYVIIAWKLVRKLLNMPGWRWLGIVFTAYGLGCVMNAILTGGRYLPFVGWFLG